MNTTETHYFCHRCGAWVLFFHLNSHESIPQCPRNLGVKHDDGPYAVCEGSYRNCPAWVSLFKPFPVEILSRKTQIDLAQCVPQYPAVSSVLRQDPICNQQTPPTVVHAVVKSMVM